LSFLQQSRCAPDKFERFCFANAKQERSGSHVSAPTQSRLLKAIREQALVVSDAAADLGCAASI
jgi:hypothetical protein